MKKAERAAAKLAGETFYFTGKPCKYGHIGKRFTSHGGCTECRTLKAPTWRRNDYEKNKPSYLARAVRWDIANPKKRKAARAKYALTVPIEITRRNARLHMHRRRAWEVAAGGSFSDKDVQNIRKWQKDKCHWCKKLLKSRGEIDHIIPLSKGGTNDSNNLCLSCQHCNRTKQAMMPEKFAGRFF